jgi:hypothetical protein
LDTAAVRDHDREKKRVARDLLQVAELLLPPLLGEARRMEVEDLRIRGAGRNQACLRGLQVRLPA